MSMLGWIREFQVEVDEHEGGFKIKVPAWAPIIVGLIILTIGGLNWRTLDKHIAVPMHFGAANQFEANNGKLDQLIEGVNANTIRSRVLDETFRRVYPEAHKAAVEEQFFLIPTITHLTPHEDPS